jgi:hypothetical protein
MPLFEYKCPSCGKTTLLDPLGECANILKSGQKCGFRFPLVAGSGNSKVREKMDKHTTPQSGLMDSDYSWVDDKASYPLYQIDTAKSGSLHLDQKMNYLFLWQTPVGENHFAKIIYANDCLVSEVSGVVLPLNSKLQNMHIHFSNYESHFVEIAPQSDQIIIQEPNAVHPSEYWVLSAQQPIFSWNPTTQLSGVPPSPQV